MHMRVTRLEETFGVSCAEKKPNDKLNLTRTTSVTAAFSASASSESPTRFVQRPSSLPKRPR